MKYGKNEKRYGPYQNKNEGNYITSNMVKKEMAGNILQERSCIYNEMRRSRCFAKSLPLSLSLCIYIHTCV